MKKILGIFFLLACFSFVPAQADDGHWGDHPFPFGEHPFPIGEHPFPFVVSAYVEAVLDGDSILIHLTDDDDLYNVTLEGIDAMELNYRGYSQGAGAQIARKRLMQVLPKGSPITLAFEEKEDGPDRRTSRRISGRQNVRAHVFYWEESLDKWFSANEKMLKEGWAVAHIIYPRTLQMRKFLDMSEDAIRQRRGMFSPQYWRGEPYHFRAWIDGGAPFWVGNASTRRVVRPDDYQNVPLFERIYFSDLSTALSQGYRLN